MDWVLCELEKNIKLNKNYPEIISKLLGLRGMTKKQEIEKFLDPEFDDLNDPFLLPDIDKAIERIRLAIENKEKVVIYGDYDADGVTATSILWDFLYRRLGLDVIPYIPSRFEEGYGLNKLAINELEKNGAKLIITVDCGVKDSGLIAKFPNIDFIVTDHHTLPEDQKFNHIVVHPGRKGSKYPVTNICGAVVAWKLVCALNEKLHIGFDVNSYLDLACVGTVCDVMPLTGENRIIVKYGLERIANTSNTGLKVLLENCNIANKKITTFDVGFIIGPRINAAGRLDNALEAVKLFATENRANARIFAQKLEALNQSRQETTINMQLEAESLLGEVTDQRKLLFVYAQNWSEGVIGLVAGRLTEKYNRPAICATIIDEQVVASARSIRSFNITQALEKQSQFLLRFGGHAQAAGFALQKSNIENLKANLEIEALKSISESDIQKTLLIDMTLTLSQIDLKLLGWLEKFEPFGIDNFQPVFAIDRLKILAINRLGRELQHLKFLLQDNWGHEIEAIIFNKADLFKDLDIGNIVDVAGNLEINEWKNSKKIQLKLKDVKMSKSSSPDFN